MPLCLCRCLCPSLAGKQGGLVQSNGLAFLWIVQSSLTGNGPSWLKPGVWREECQESANDRALLMVSSVNLCAMLQGVG